MAFVPALAMIALIKKLVDFTRYAKAGDINGIITQLVAWAAGIAVFFLAAQSDWADGIEIGDRALSVLNGWSLVMAGLAAGSSASVFQDFLKSNDNTNSAAIPTLLPPGGTQPTHGTRETG